MAFEFDKLVYVGQGEGEAGDDAKRRSDNNYVLQQGVRVRVQSLFCVDPFFAILRAKLFSTAIFTKEAMNDLTPTQL